MITVVLLYFQNGYPTTKDILTGYYFVNSTLALDQSCFAHPVDFGPGNRALSSEVYFGLFPSMVVGIAVH